MRAPDGPCPFSSPSYPGVEGPLSSLEPLSKGSMQSTALCSRWGFSGGPRKKSIGPLTPGGDEVPLPQLVSTPDPGKYSYCRYLRAPHTCAHRSTCTPGQGQWYGDPCHMLGLLVPSLLVAHPSGLQKLTPAAHLSLTLGGQGLLEGHSFLVCTFTWLRAQTRGWKLQ